MKFKQVRKQKGFVLAASMIFLIIMTALAVTAIKKSTSDEKVANNLRSQNIAFQAAEKALRFCESRIELRTGNVNICKLKDSTTPHEEDIKFPEKWKSTDIWKNGANVIKLTGVDQVAGVAAQPQCLIEQWKFPAEPGKDPEHSWVITSRAVGNVDSAIVTLQEVLRCGNS